MLRPRPRSASPFWHLAFGALPAPPWSVTDKAMTCVETSAATILLTEAPEPKVRDRQTGEIAKGAVSGEALMTIGVVYTEDGESSLIKVTIPEGGVRGARTRCPGLVAGAHRPAVGVRLRRVWMPRKAGAEFLKVPVALREDAAPFVRDYRTVAHQFIFGATRKRRWSIDTPTANGNASRRPGWTRWCASSVRSATCRSRQRVNGAVVVRAPLIGLDSKEPPSL